MSAPPSPRLLRLRWESAVSRQPKSSPVFQEGFKLPTPAKLAVIIMAAGKGTRLKSQRPKVLHEIGGKSLLAHVIAAATHIVAAQDIYAVVGHQAERVKQAVAASGINFIEQTEQRGTGHAIQCTRDAVSGYEDILVLSGDAPLIQPSTLSALLEFHKANGAAMTLTSAEPGDPTGYGRVIHPAGDAVAVTGIIEQKMLSPEQVLLREGNMGLYAFKTAPLFANLQKLTTANPHGELYLTDMAHVLHDAGERVVAFKTSAAAELLGANTIAEMMALDAHLRVATAQRHMAAGVTIFRPETCVIDAEVEIAADTVIEPFVQLLGRTRIGSECRIRSYSVIENCTLGNDVLIRQSCVLADSTIADQANIGPFAHLRPGSEIGEAVHIGNFVETKKARLHKGVKAGHLSYLGDTEIGENTNIGAGVITCNYDGIHKHPTKIGRDAFIGSDSTLVAPVTIGDGAFVGAGSCITRNIPAEALALARAQQVVKQGWSRARRESRKTPTDPSANQNG
jgi:bifunctional UDP-N-acetylglucosamine pyrophosphorylase/glucosamine-1-phosphate N-acetyltransferase